MKEFENQPPPPTRNPSISTVGSSYVSPDKGMRIIDGGLSDQDDFQQKKSSRSGSIAIYYDHLKRKTALLYGRKRSAEKLRNFK